MVIDQLKSNPVMKPWIIILMFFITDFSIYGEVPVVNHTSDNSILHASDSSIIIRAGDNYLCIDFISPSVFRIRLNNKERFPEGGMVRYGIVNTKRMRNIVKITANDDYLELKTEKARLDVSKNDGKVVLYDNNGNILIRNDQSPSSAEEKGFHLSFTLKEEERLYGFGDVSRTSIERRGLKSQMLVTNRTGYIPIPYVMSDKGWGLFLNTTMLHYADAGATVKNRLSFNAQKGIIDYYLIAGVSLPDLLDKYTSITGKPHLLPKWGYGLTWVCDERGVRARDVLYEAYEFRRHGIPCDVIGLEPDWMEKHYDYSTKKQWSKERFDIPSWMEPGSPSSFPGALNNMGFKLSLWLCTNYDFSEYEEWKLKYGSPVGEGQTFKKNAIGEEIILDQRLGDKLTDKSITPPKESEPWFEHLKKFVNDGASMFKLDGSNQVTLKIKPGHIWKNGMDDYEMINLYPLLYNKQMSLGFREYTGKRAMIFTAGGYAGIQRYSASWAGDTGGGSSPLISLLNHGLSGHSNVCTDMLVRSNEGIHFGFFQTLSQVLGWVMYVEPWFLGEKRAAVFKDYANLRYRIFPYIYSMAHIASEKAIPVMRAMPLMFQNDTTCDNYTNQYMFGDAFLVSAFQKTVYLPEGEWIDYWTGKKLNGRQVIPAEYPENKGGPLFVKAGSIIPTQKVPSHIGTETPEEIIWEIFPKGESKFTLYEDDGQSYKYLEGAVAKTLVECSEIDKEIVITVNPRSGSYENMPEKRTHSFRISGQGKMKLMNRNIPWQYDKYSNVLTTGNIEENGQRLQLVIKK